MCIWGSELRNIPHTQAKITYTPGRINEQKHVHMPAHTHNYKSVKITILRLLSSTVVNKACYKGAHLEFVLFFTMPK